MWVPSLGLEDPLEEGTAAHSSILAWRIPWTEEPGRLQSIGHSHIGLHSFLEALRQSLFACSSQFLEDACIPWLMATFSMFKAGTGKLSPYLFAHLTLHISL